MPAALPTGAEVYRIIDAEKRISGNIRWQHNPDHDSGWAKFRVVVESDAGWDLALYGNVALAPPDRQPKRSFSLVLRGRRIYALDVNGSHKNRHVNNDEWNHQTHKQRWKDAYGTQIAFTPDESIPEEPAAAFLEFCRECNIVFTGQITEEVPTT